MSYEVVPQGRKYVLIWLNLIAFLVLSMIILGGLTRLTGSGLSMVDWRPIMGAVPPIGEEAWMETFNQYKQFPEYQKVNKGMSLSEFKFIFAMEYSHRLLGRAVGLVFFFPFVFFLWKRWMNPGMIKRGVFLFVLGGLQGLMGWYMVKSGLVDEPRVSQYRLVAHFSLAMLVFTLCLWYSFTLARGQYHGKYAQFTRYKVMAIVSLTLVGMQMISGGFVAGLDAGLAFNTWPTMNGQWVPAGLWSHSPIYANLFDNMVMVQFFHRTSAYVVTAVVLVFFFRARKELAQGPGGFMIYLLPIILAIQVILGITTLLMRVPVSLGSLHQMGAVALWSVALFLCHRCVRAG